jgi:hypothetical protein
LLTAERFESGRGGLERGKRGPDRLDNAREDRAEWSRGFALPSSVAAAPSGRNRVHEQAAAFPGILRLTKPGEFPVQQFIIQQILAMGKFSSAPQGNKADRKYNADMDGYKSGSGCRQKLVPPEGL